MAISKAQFLAANYPFLALHPKHDGVAIHITDCPTFDVFYLKWIDEPNVVLANFNYDDPTIIDDNCVTVEKFTKGPKAYWVENVIAMTYAEYVKLVNDYIEEKPLI